MISTLLMSLFSLICDLLAILRTSKSETDLEILILCQQVRILQRKTKTPPRISDPERMVLATLLDRYSRFKDGTLRNLGHADQEIRRMFDQQFRCMPIGDSGHADH